MLDHVLFQTIHERFVLASLFDGLLQFVHDVSSRWGGRPDSLLSCAKGVTAFSCADSRTIPGQRALGLLLPGSLSALRSTRLPPQPWIAHPTVEWVQPLLPGLSSVASSGD